MELNDIIDMSSIKPGTSTFFTIEGYLREQHPEQYPQFLEITIDKLKNEGNENSLLLGTMYSKLGYSLLREDDTQAEELFKKAIKIYENRLTTERNKERRKNLKRWIAYNTGEVAVILLRKSNRTDALHFLKKEVKEFEDLEGIIDDNERKTQLAPIYYHLGRLILNANEKDVYLKKSVEYYSDPSIKVTEKVRLEKLIDLYRRLGNLYENELKENYLELALNSADEYNSRFDEHHLGEGFLRVSYAFAIKSKNPMDERIEPNYKTGIELLEKQRSTNPPNKLKLDKTLAVASYILAVHLYKKGKTKEEIEYLKKTIQYGNKEEFKDDIKTLERVRNAAYFLTKRGFYEYHEIHQYARDRIIQLESSPTINNSRKII